MLFDFPVHWFRAFQKRAVRTKLKTFKKKVYIWDYFDIILSFYDNLMIKTYNYWYYVNIIYI